MNNKGEVTLGDLNGVTMAFLLTGIFFAIGIVILAAFQTNTYTSTTVTLENITLPNATGMTVNLANGRVQTINSIQNGTGFVLGSGNYSLVSTTAVPGQINFTANSSIVGLCNLGTTGQWCLVNYTYLSNTTAAPVSVANTIEAMSEIPNNWLTLIAIVLAAAIVIGIVVKNLGGSTNSR